MHLLKTKDGHGSRQVLTSNRTKPDSHGSDSDLSPMSALNHKDINIAIAVWIAHGKIKLNSA
ncbi:hypothetical protein BC374_03625 [Ensifer sp. LC13]|nr:hypothetical protein BC362_23750 [Ensifer sp. LC14]OCP04592.1 hypothetical protein BBX50_25235 [Ensifer sp. LC11]OCP09644.1 hypothetical protein BC374_03625 [Ensifer sp. LC13]OCP30690.1 hypothetical protein BC364_24915 [Ensifer sp. LC499]